MAWTDAIEGVTQGGRGGGGWPNLKLILASAASVYRWSPTYRISSPDTPRATSTMRALPPQYRPPLTAVMQGLISPSSVTTSYRLMAWLKKSGFLACTMTCGYALVSPPAFMVMRPLLASLVRQLLTGLYRRLQSWAGITSTCIWLTCTAYYVIKSRLEIRFLVMWSQGNQGMLILNLGSELDCRVRKRPLRWHEGAHVHKTHLDFIAAHCASALSAARFRCRWVSVIDCDFDSEVWLGALQRHCCPCIHAD